MVGPWTILVLNHVIWAINREYRSRGLSSALERVKKTGQDRTKSQNGYISPICGEAPTEAMYMKICLLGDVLDVITCAKFQNEIFRGYDFAEGRISHFPIVFWMGLTTALHRYFAACDKCSVMTATIASCSQNFRAKSVIFKELTWYFIIFYHEILRGYSQILSNSFNLS